MPLTLAITSILDWLPWLLVSGGGVVVIAVAVWVTFKRRVPQVQTPAARLARARQRAAGPAPGNFGRAEASAHEAMLEVKHLADAVVAELDDKAARLERLILSADERIAALERLHALPTPGEARHQGGRAGEPAGEAPDPITTQIVTLAGQGLSPVQIAQRLGQGVGTVELVLALRR